MKFGQLIEHNMRNIFIEISYTRYGGETTPRPFSGKSNLSISWAKLSSSFILYANLRAIEI